MGQTKAVSDQPSMEDILTSIRRIIDDSNANTPNTSVPSANEVANDDSAASAVAAEKRNEKLDADQVEQVAKEAIDEIPELDSFLEALDAKYSAQQRFSDDSVPEPKADAETTKAVSEQIASEQVDASIPMIDEAMGAAKAVEPVAAKPEARLSADDESAFKAVGTALSAKAAEEAKQPAATPSEFAHEPIVQASGLVSEPNRARIGDSLNSLTDSLAKEAQRHLPEMTESMLKPMLSEWLDNNLPSMVERLVREEIERIARGD